MAIKHESGEVVRYSPHTALWQTYQGRIALLAVHSSPQHEQAKRLLERLQGSPSFELGRRTLIQPIGSVATETAIAFSSTSRAAAPVNLSRFLESDIAEAGGQAEVMPFRSHTDPNDAWSVFDVAAAHVLGRPYKDEGLSIIAVSAAADFNGAKLGLHVPADGLALVAEQVAGRSSARQSPFTFKAV